MAAAEAVLHLSVEQRLLAAILGVGEAPAIGGYPARDDRMDAGVPLTPPSQYIDSVLTDF